MALKHKLYCETLSCKMAYAVKGVKRLLSRRFAEEEIALTIEQYFILNILDNEEGLILKELTDILDRDKSAVARHLNGLEENHLVARAQDPQDKRRKILLVTKQGINALEKARSLDRQIHQEVTSQVSKNKLEDFEQLISDMYEYTLSFEDD